MENPVIVPFLKWAGGKRWLAPKIAALIDDDARLVEPFLGSGAVFFRVAPRKSILSDINTDLIATFKVVRDHPEVLINRLSRLRILPSVFERMRLWRPTTDVDRAVRLIYLNKTAFNGLYRVNRLGGFNVPFGCKPGTRLCDRQGIRAASRALRGARIISQDFRVALAKVKPADIVYADPPYTVKHDKNGFRRYHEKIFSWQDQQELATRLTELAKNGTRIIVSNAHHDSIRKMYARKLFLPIPMARTTCMAGDASRRGTCIEWLLVSCNFEVPVNQIKEIATSVLAGPICLTTTRNWLRRAS